MALAHMGMRRGLRGEELAADDDPAHEHRHQEREQHHDGQRAARRPCRAHAVPLLLLHGEEEGGNRGWEREWEWEWEWEWECGRAGRAEWREELEGHRREEGKEGKGWGLACGECDGKVDDEKMMILNRVWMDGWDWRREMERECVVLVECEGVCANDIGRLSPGFWYGILCNLVWDYLWRSVLLKVGFSGVDTMVSENDASDFASLVEVGYAMMIGNRRLFGAKG